MKRLTLLLTFLILLVLSACNGVNITVTPLDSNSELSNVLINDDYLAGFDSTKLEYDVDIDYCETLEVKGVAKSSKSTVQNDPKIDNVEGNKTYRFSIKCTSENGYSTTYVINVNVGENEDKQPDDTPVVETYTVTFNSKGGSSVANAEVESGKTVAQPTNPTLTGHTFKHWSLTDGGEAYNFSTPVTANITLYAVWEANQNEDDTPVDPVVETYTITFNTQGGSTVASQTVNSGSAVTKPSSNPTKTGYNFIYWSTTADGTEYDFNTKVTSSFTLYAIWEIVKEEETTNVYVLDGKIQPEGFTLADEANLYYKSTAGATIGTNDFYSITSDNVRWEGKSNRLCYNTQGTAKVTQCSIAFTALATGTLDWSIQNRSSSNTGLVLLDSDGKVVYSVTLAKDEVKEGTFNITAPGTYYIGGASGSIGVFSLTFTEGELPDNNSSLASLVVNGDEITLTSGVTTYYYTIYGTKTFTIEATPAISTSSVTGTGSKTMSQNNETYSLVVTAEDGSSTTYTINVVYLDSESQVNITYHAGLYESIALTYLGSTDYTVQYKVSSSSTYLDVDSELIRLQSSGQVRVDIVGLAAGTYDVKVNNTEIKGIQVYNYDRSGYAHYNNSTGVGAYNNDGTLKDNAIVVYVSDATKNTVTAKIGSKTYTGLANILINAKNSSYPIVIRILDEIQTTQWNSISYASLDTVNLSTVTGANGKLLTEIAKTVDGKQRVVEADIIAGGYNSMSDDLAKGITQLNGLTNRATLDGTEWDSYWNMLDISGAENVTVEGIGTEAGIFQWGFTWKNCNSIEVRNLRFKSNTEDACSFEGSSTSISSTSDVDNMKSKYLWVHNNEFNIGVNNWDVCPEQDKNEGDGATDFKYNSYITISYNHYIKNHKTGLIGGGDSHLTYNVTFHHNYYESNNSRLPLGRQANMHMYNNYYYGSTGTNMSIRATGYAFIENCYFENAKNPIEVKVDTNGAAKVYNCQFVGCTGTNDGTVVSDRTTAVTNSNLYGDFDTNSSVFYYDSTNKVSDVEYMTDAAQAKQDCINYAGVLKEGQTTTIFNQ